MNPKPKKKTTQPQNPVNAILSGISKLGASLTGIVPKPSQKKTSQHLPLRSRSNALVSTIPSKSFSESLKENPLDAVKKALNKPIPNNPKFAVRDFVVGLGAIGSTIGLASYTAGKSIANPNIEPYRKHLTDSLDFPPSLVKKMHFVGPSKTHSEFLMRIFADTFIRRAEFCLPLSLMDYFPFEITMTALDRVTHLWTTDPEYLPLSSKAFRSVRLATCEDANGKSFDAQTIRRWQPLKFSGTPIPLESLMSLCRPYGALRLFPADAFVEYDFDAISDLHMKEVMIDASVLSQGYYPLCDYYDALVDSKIPIAVSSLGMESLRINGTSPFETLEAIIVDTLRKTHGTEPLLIEVQIPKTRDYSRFRSYDIIWETKYSDSDLQFFHALQSQAGAPQSQPLREIVSPKPNELPIGSHQPAEKKKEEN